MPVRAWKDRFPNENVPRTDIRKLRTKTAPARTGSIVKSGNYDFLSYSTGVAFAISEPNKVESKLRVFKSALTGKGLHRVPDINRRKISMFLQQLSPAYTENRTTSVTLPPNRMRSSRSPPHWNSTVCCPVVNARFVKSLLITAPKRGSRALAEGEACSTTICFHDSPGAIKGG
jgi:hypothetical protein